MIPEVMRGDAARRELFSEYGADVYAVLDGASVPELPQLLWDYAPEHVCLYSGDLEPDMAEVAPYLVKLDDASRFTVWTLEQGWGNHWGVFVIAPADVSLGEMRRHFRKFLMVRDADGKPLYFRYYDPRVLRDFLPTCEAQELESVFGPVRSFVVEGADPSALLRFSREDGTLRTESVPLR